eukprot:1231739-Amphidinium_carterae.1
MAFVSRAAAESGGGVSVWRMILVNQVLMFLRVSNVCKGCWCIGFVLERLVLSLGNTTET